MLTGITKSRQHLRKTKRVLALGHKTLFDLVCSIRETRRRRSDYSGTPCDMVSPDNRLSAKDGPRAIGVANARVSGT